MLCTPTNAVTPSSSQTQTMCSYCNKSETLEKIQKCSDCHFAFYCNRSCQKKHWKNHKVVCRQLKQQSEFWKQRELTTKPHPHWKHFPLGMVFSRLQELPFNFRLEEELVAIDLGCGNGWSVEWLLARGWRVIALDYYQELLDKTEKLALKTNDVAVVSSKLETVRMNVFDYNFPIKAELIIAQDLFPYLDPLKLGELFRKIHHALKPEGWILGSFFTSEHRCLKMYAGWSVKDVDTVKELISDGFEVERCHVRMKKFGPGNSIDFSAIKKDPVNEESSLKSKF